MRRAKKCISKNLKNLGPDLLDDDTTRCIQEAAAERHTMISISKQNVRAGFFSRSLHPPTPKFIHDVDSGQTGWFPRILENELSSIENLRRRDKLRYNRRIRQ